MPIEGIAFDLEGTVVDVEEAHHKGHLVTAREFGVHIPPEEAFKKLPHFIGGPDRAVCEEIRSLMDPADAEGVTVDEILDRDRFHYDRLLQSMPIELRPGFVDFYEAAKAMGLPMTIGSLTEEAQARKLLEGSRLVHLLGEENIVLREHVQEVKPAPDVFWETARRMTIDPKSQVVFEDSPRGVTAAKRAGSLAVGMPVIIKGETIASLVDAGASQIFFDWRVIDAKRLVSVLNEKP